MYVARPHGTSSPPGPHGTTPPRPPAPPPPVLDSTSLLGGQREIRIQHGNETYRLRHTRNDKLILTK
ncbi:hemin uptake protein HemP [Lysobacter sp. GX 14042]|uniref:hemin uptake protein HemP n=1 Tax=Lysobacter sp. GX 14042 TaxID=2907155 RepID=UPI001F1CCF73|nr:hemin uptake protein HemP [Lysobacter sp. GX 14042]MCE7032632.1 hemin uptake protein HemP [Lysobacter sp. GX 14042]